MRHVALLIETTGSYGRGLLAGIAQYNRQHGGWSTYFRPQGMTEAAPAWLDDWKGDGMLVRIHTPQLAAVVLRVGVPVVNLRGIVPNLPFPYVTVDHAQVAELAARHLLERGLRHFGFCGRPRGTNPTLDERADHFRRVIESGGGTHSLFPAASAVWEEEQERLAEWVMSLPKPVGIMAANDERGLQVLDACRRCGAVVPDEVAVIGADNDPLLCELSIPPLSSVDVNAEKVGYEAAALLDRMMDGHKPPARIRRLAPRGVVTRRSTDTIASEDEEVSAAVRYIREYACRGLQVTDVLRSMGMSRASLQQRMKRILNRTIHDEIQRVRLNRAQTLLAMSNLTIKQVARESGFSSVQYMTRVFRALVGETPAKYRAGRAK